MEHYGILPAPDPGRAAPHRRCGETKPYGVTEELIPSALRSRGYTRVTVGTWYALGVAQHPRSCRPGQLFPNYTN